MVWHDPLKAAFAWPSVLGKAQLWQLPSSKNWWQEEHLAGCMGSKVVSKGAMVGGTCGQTDPNKEKKERPEFLWKFCMFLLRFTSFQPLEEIDRHSLTTRTAQIWSRLWATALSTAVNSCARFTAGLVQRGRVEKKSDDLGVQVENFNCYYIIAVDDFHCQLKSQFSKCCSSQIALYNYCWFDTVSLWEGNAPNVWSMSQAMGSLENSFLIRWRSANR